MGLGCPCWLLGCQGMAMSLQQCWGDGPLVYDIRRFGALLSGCAVLLADAPADARPFPTLSSMTATQ